MIMRAKNGNPMIMNSAGIRTYIGTQKLNMELFADKLCFNLKPGCLTINV